MLLILLVFSFFGIPVIPSAQVAMYTFHACRKSSIRGTIRCVLFDEDNDNESANGSPCGRGQRTRHGLPFGYGDVVVDGDDTFTTSLVMVEEEEVKTEELCILFTAFIL